MKIIKLNVFWFFTIVIVTLINLIIWIKKKNDLIHYQHSKIVKLELLNKKLENNLKLILNINTKKFQNKYILYFPKNACNACLEQIILTLSDKQAIWNDFILYSESEQLRSIVNYLTDAYSINFNFVVGNKLFNCQTNNPVFMKFEENRICQLLEITIEDITKLDSLLKNYEILIQ